LAEVVRASMRAYMLEQQHPAFWGAFGLVGAEPWSTMTSSESAAGAMKEMHT
jgi:hypothetical protein